MSESREIHLPADLCATVERRFGNVFGSVDELLIFLLQELVRGNTIELDQADQALVEERLRDLGYI